MKKLALALAFAFAAQPIAAFADEPVRTVASAPADEYFGAYQISVLGIRNAIRDLGAHVGDDGRVFAKLVSVEAAMADWRARYPHDAWLPREGLRMARIFARLNVPAAAAHERATCAWIGAEFPDADEAGAAIALQGGSSDADPSAPIGPSAVAAVASAADIPLTRDSAAASDVAPGLAPDPAATFAPQTHNATGGIVAATAVAAVAAFVLLRRHH